MTEKKQKRIIEQIAAQLPTPHENKIVSGRDYKAMLTRTLNALIALGKESGQDTLRKRIAEIDEAKYYQLGGDTHIQRVNHARQMWKLYSDNNGYIVNNVEEQRYQIVCPAMEAYFDKHNVKQTAIPA